jgi:adenosine deaminase
MAIGLGELDKVLSSRQRRALVRSFSVEPGSSFADLEVVYTNRRQISQVEKVLPDLLLEVGRESRLRGVDYLELSSSSFVKRGTPDELDQLIAVVDDVERQTGVRLRFLHGFPRAKPAAENVAAIRQMVANGFYSPRSPIVGIDIQGYEDTSILRQRAIFDEVKQIKKLNPTFILRVHAGETPKHLARPEDRDLFSKNVLYSIMLGADRIGHGIYGVNRRVLREAAKRRVIFEVNPRSNEVLGYTPARHPLVRLLHAGVPIVLSTDGAGIFRTSVSSQIARIAHDLQLKPRDMRALRRASKAYLIRR